MTDEFTDLSRAERAYSGLFAERADGADFAPLDSAALSSEGVAGRGRGGCYRLPQSRSWPLLWA